MHRTFTPRTSHILLMLAAAWILRMLVGIWSETPIHPDEVFQYYEQAFRLVHGYGVIPWEYDFGIRSWFIPLLVAAPLELAAGAGFDAPWQYDGLVKATFSLISLSAPVGMYMFARLAFDERIAGVAFVLGCVWHTLLHFADTPMPSILAGYGFLWAGVAFLRPQKVATAITFGLLCGLVFVVRYQLLPAVGLLALFYVWRYPATALWAVLGFGGVVIFAGLLDLVFWGAFLFSFTNNFLLNFTADISAAFGVSTVLYFAKTLIVETWLLILPATLGLFLCKRQAWPILIAGFVGFAFFHIPGHKEFRFIVWAMPIVLVGLAASFVWVWAHPTLSTRRKHAGLGVLLLWCIATNVTKTAAYIGEPFQPASLYESQEQVFHALSHRNDVVGIEMRTPGLPWWRGLGYYGLGRPVPIQFTYWPGRAPLLSENVSHMITEEQTAPDGFEAAGQYGQLYLWRSQASASPKPFDSVDFQAPYPAASLNELDAFKACIAYGLDTSQRCR